MIHDYPELPPPPPPPPREVVREVVREVLPQPQPTVYREYVPPREWEYGRVSPRRYVDASIYEQYPLTQGYLDRVGYRYGEGYRDQPLDYMPLQVAGRSPRRYSDSYYERYRERFPRSPPRFRTYHDAPYETEPWPEPGYYAPPEMTPADVSFSRMKAQYEAMKSSGKGYY